MRSGLIIRIVVLAIIALTTFIILHPSVKTQPASIESKEECCEKKCKASEDNNLIWEPISRQLISVSVRPITQ